MRNRSEHMASEEPPGEYDREDFRPSSIGRTRSGLREPRRPETSFEPAERDTKKSQTRMVLRIGPRNSVGAELVSRYCRVTSKHNSIY
jgi:hypothetical protein